MTRYIWSPELYTIAYKFAATYHQYQKYPGTDLPYIMHLSFVAMEVMAALALADREDGNLAVQCALLHDVLEDTEATYADVCREFGSGVAAGVLALTKSATLPKSQQMEDSLRRLRLQPPAVRMVKLADRAVARASAIESSIYKNHRTIGLMRRLLPTAKKRSSSTALYMTPIFISAIACN
jgi:(p)ppGpp synthase/HD superfamily hydrolase